MLNFKCEKCGHQGAALGIKSGRQTHDKSPVMVLAGKKAWQTRRINRLFGSYSACGQSPGRKSAIRKMINKIRAERIA